MDEKEGDVNKRELRIVAVGDELVAGVGDPRALGWLGRVLARTPNESVSLESFVLASPREGTEALASRWLQEASRRFDDSHENRLVIGLSGRDIEYGLSTARSRLNLANILDGATQLSIPVFVVVLPGRRATVSWHGWSCTAAGINGSTCPRPASPAVAGQRPVG